ncbi:MAG: hypothetical protein ABWJ42_04555 [Sulfolobales archaeon]
MRSLRSSVRSVSRVVEFLLEYFFYSIFVGDDNSSRHTPVILNLLVVLLIVFVVSREGVSNLFIGVLIMLILMILKRDHLIYKPVLVISLIPSIWYLALSYLIRPSIILSLEAMLRVFVISVSTMLFIQQLNPLEISWLLNRLKLSPKNSLYLSLVWRVSPHLLKDLRTALMINRVKNTELWKSLAVSMIVFDEYADLYEEGLLSRDIKRIVYWYDLGETFKSLTVLAIGLLLYVLLNYFS